MQEWKKQPNVLQVKFQVDDALDIAGKDREKNFKKIQACDLSYFNGRRYFDNDGSQNH